MFSFGLCLIFVVRIIIYSFQERRVEKRAERMNLFLFLLLLLISVLSFPALSVPLDVKPDPPASDPVVPTEKDPFFKNSSDLTAHSPEAADLKLLHHQDLNKKIHVAHVVSSSLLGVILLFLTCFWIFRLRKRSYAKNHQNSDAANGISFGPILDKFPSMRIGVKKGFYASIEYQLLVTATDNFDEAYILGEGGLGRVYKAHFHAAIKKIYAGGLEAEREFENEVESLSKIQHQNIVSL